VFLAKGFSLSNEENQKIAAEDQSSVPRSPVAKPPPPAPRAPPSPLSNNAREEAKFVDENLVDEEGDIQEKVSQLMELGFREEEATAAILEAGGCVAEAADRLLAKPQPESSSESNEDILDSPKSVSQRHSASASQALSAINLPLTAEDKPVAESHTDLSSERDINSFNSVPFNSEKLAPYADVSSDESTGGHVVSEAILKSTAEELCSTNERRSEGENPYELAGTPVADNSINDYSSDHFNAAQEPPSSPPRYGEQQGYEHIIRPFKNLDEVTPRQGEPSVYSHAAPYNQEEGRRFGGSLARGEESLNYGPAASENERLIRPPPKVEHRPYNRRDEDQLPLREGRNPYLSRPDRLEVDGRISPSQGSEVEIFKRRLHEMEHKEAADLTKDERLWVINLDHRWVFSRMEPPERNRYEALYKELLRKLERRRTPYRYPPPDVRPAADRGRGYSSYEQPYHYPRPRREVKGRMAPNSQTPWDRPPYPPRRSAGPGPMPHRMRLDRPPGRRNIPHRYPNPPPGPVGHQRVSANFHRQARRPEPFHRGQPALNRHFPGPRHRPPPTPGDPHCFRGPPPAYGEVPPPAYGERLRPSYRGAPPAHHRYR